MSQSYSDHSHHDGEIPCREIARKVYQFIEGQLDIGELEKFKEHIAICLPCRDVVQFEKKLIEIIRLKGGNDGANRASVPGSLAEKIRQAMRLIASPVVK